MKAICEAKKNGKKVIEDLEALDKSSTSATKKTSIANSKTEISKAIEGLDKVHGFMLWNWMIRDYSTYTFLNKKVVVKQSAYHL